MELRQLQYLVDVIDEASFTKAAAKAHVAQPGVSAQIRSLEREVGQTLLDRSGGTVRPTEAGTAILPYARTALGAIAGIRQTADELAGLVRGHLTLGMVASISTPSVGLPKLLSGFHHDHPGVEITLAEGPTGHLVSELRAGKLDVALIGLGPQPPDGIETRILATEPIAVAVSDEHPLARSASVTLGSLREHTLITLPTGTGVRAHLDAACAAAGLRPRIAFEAGDPRLLAELAAQGLGAAILPASAASAHPAPLRVLTLTRPHIQGHIALAWRAGHPASPATRAFLRQARANPIASSDCTPRKGCNPNQ